MMGNEVIVVRRPRFQRSLRFSSRSVQQHGRTTSEVPSMACGPVEWLPTHWTPSEGMAFLPATTGLNAALVPQDEVLFCPP